MHPAYIHANNTECDKNKHSVNIHTKTKNVIKYILPIYIQITENVINYILSIFIKTQTVIKKTVNKHTYYTEM